ncbi:hypothetical protein [Hymenobacter sp. GOD-10R]|uniref:hypothetical protein n=1 Tax=Hymenobacter sp. GOD-10R TaxID=3093922 RepID=UPI002D784E75|nr:hypothetical protein [Hymenobacter sp. GOD-10R]WRQ31780.1 hypothetical protein SD425_28435 [Hymenobacter sp. GOD-10R]
MGDLISGGNGANGKASVCGKDGTPLVEMLALDNEAVLGAGNKARPGRLTMYDKNGNPTVNVATADASLTLGSGGTNGKVSVRGKEGTALVELLAADTEAVIAAGNKNRGGRLTLYNKQGSPTVNLTTADATLTLGGNATNGKVSVQGQDGMPIVELIASDTESIIGLGQSNRPGRITVYNGNQDASIELNGAQGDIWISNADFAEEFDVATNTDVVLPVERGMVMVLGAGGDVEPSSSAYDSRVVGVVSGAGTYRPGLVLDRRDTGNERLPIALVGKVFCLVDATNAPVQIGDLLTTANQVGHAMKATDRQAAFGAVLGKALAPLETGSALLPILVTLQ